MNLSRPRFASVANGVVTSFGMIRQFDRGYCIGPLFADSPDLAHSMFQALCAQRHGEVVFLDEPQVKCHSIALAERYGMAQVFETARMYTGAAPDLPLDRIYGITSFELG